MIANEETQSPVSQALSLHPGRTILSDVEWQSTASALKLTPRELQVCRHLFQGKTRNQIASDLGIKPRTVRQHMESIHVKLNVSNRVEVALRIVQLKRATAIQSEPKPVESAGQYHWRQ